MGLGTCGIPVCMACSRTLGFSVYVEKKMDFPPKNPVTSSKPLIFCSALSGIKNLNRPPSDLIHVFFLSDGFPRVVQSN